MSVDMYRKQKDQIQSTISRLMEQKARETQRSVDASSRSLSAQIAASKATSISTAQSKLREASRYATEHAKHEREIAKLEKRISDEQKKFTTALQRLEKEEDKQLKKHNDEQKRQQQLQQNQLRSMESNLMRHETLHDVAIQRLDELSLLPEKITVAFFATDPATASDRRLLLDEEVREIQEKLRLSDHRDAIKLESRWALRPGDILQYMNELAPTIVHFSGHGTNQDELVLQNSSGNAAIISLSSIVNMFEHFDFVRLIFFNTCHSYNQAAACTQHVDAAIGMNQEIGDQAARIFAAQFYSAIGFGKSIPHAFKQAKSALMLEGIKEDSTPVLHLRPGVNESDLVLVTPKS